MDPLTFVVVVCTGAVTGLIGSLLGIGGGLFLIPALVLGFGLPMHQALAASIVAVIATSSTTASVYIERGTSNVRLGMSLEVATTIGALAGGLAANSLPGGTLRMIFAVFLLCMGTLMAWRMRVHGEGRFTYDPTARISGRYVDQASGQEVRYSVRNLPAGSAVSLAAGVMSGLLGVGGGIVKVPVMNAVCGVPIKTATATSNFMIGVTAVASAFIYFANGHVEPAWTAAAVLGVLAGSRAGTMLSARMHGRTILTIFIALIFIVAIRMFFQ